MTDLEKRLINTERALISLWGLLEDTLPPEHRGNIGRMMEEYFDANKSLGTAFSNSPDYFLTNPDPSNPKR